MESQFPCHTYLSGIGVLGRTQKAVLSAVDAGEKAAEKFTESEAVKLLEKVKMTRTNPVYVAMGDPVACGK